jgi:transposase InsO family protein
MSIRRVIVEVDPATLNVAEFCRLHGVSTWFFWDLRRRHAREGDAALEPRSRAPGRVANKTPVEVEDAVVAMRKRLVDLGLDAGPGSIADRLASEGPVPSEATIWRILKTRGFITAQPSKAPKTAGARFHTATRANDCWQLDDTAWALADGTEVKVFNVIDDHSRLLVASVAMESCTGSAALDALVDAAAELGWPRRFLSDNAKAFRHTVADALAALGVTASHTRPSRPQSNGKVERFHQTLKKRLAALPAAATVAELQDQLDDFRIIYNHERPHRSTGRRTPADAWTSAPKSGPSDRPITTPTVIYRGTVNGGTFHAGSTRVISVGAAHNGTTALAAITGHACHVFINGQLVRQLTIDPTRDVQALHPRPGRPPTVRDDPRHP